MKTRITGIFLALLLPFLVSAQGGDQQLRQRAEGLFKEKRFSEAMPLYAQLVSLHPTDRDLSYRFGTCILHSAGDKERAIGFLKFATEDPSMTPKAWYYLGRAYHLNYRFNDALAAYQRYKGTEEKRLLAAMPVDALEDQCRNGLKLLGNIKEVSVRRKVEVQEDEFFRFYDLSDIGGRIVVTPPELLSSLDKRSKRRSLIYLPDHGGPIFFSSYGKDGRTGLDIYRTELLPDGRFATPEKLPGHINTDQDEDFAFMHRDGRTFYFSSTGHTSMGGFDVFRSSYDRGLDTYGTPENLDFAINTPDDDFLYLTDAEGGEACFASARSSDQGRVHVYRVSTARVPVVITVLKGTYASEIDKDDRKARIVVEDALTKEVVADVRTDINGNYVLALPRTGRYRFLVDAGPQGRTHVGNVEVPRSDGPRAYRQELSLTMHAAQEKLVIRNYFDEPLGGDLIAMALDEIKRRANLDVGEAGPFVQQPAAEAPEKDLLTEAGFSGDMGPADVQQLADESVLLAQRRAGELQDQAELAYGLALDAVAEAERAARAAEEALSAANAAPDDAEDVRTTHMLDAANERQRSRDAQLRARAAFQAGRDLQSASLTARQRAGEQERIATELRSATAGDDRARTLSALRAVKAAADERAKGTGMDDPHLAARGHVSEKEREAAQAMRRAASRSEEETELASRVERMKKEAADTKNRARREELEREVAALDVQRMELRREATDAYARAAALEREAAIARGQSSLVKHLAEAGQDVPANALPKDQVDALGQRINSTEARVAAIQVDQRYEGMLAISPQERERGAFAWGQRADAIAAVPTTRVQPMDRADEPRIGASGAAGGGQAPTGAADAPGSGTDARDAADQGEGSKGALAEAGHDQGRDERQAADQGTGAGTDRAGQEAPVKDAPPAGPEAAAINDRSDAESDALSADVREPMVQDQERSLAVQDSDLVSMGRGVPAPEPLRPDAEEAGQPGIGVAQEPAADGAVTGDEDVPGREGMSIGGETAMDGPARDVSTSAEVDGQRVQGESTAGPDDRAGALAATPEEVREREMPVPVDRAVEIEARIAMVEEQRFIKENELAELRQTSAAERDREKRRSMDQRIESIAREAEALAEEERAARKELEALVAAREGAEEPLSTGTDVDREPIRFDAITTDAAILEMVYSGHGRDRAAMERIEDPSERIEAVRGLELMVADSLRAEMDRQMSLLTGEARERDEAMERITRLQRLQQQHQRMAEPASGAEVIADAAPTGSEEERYLGAQPDAAAMRDVPAPRAAAERYVAMERDTEDIYNSHITHRSGRVEQAVQDMDRDLARIDALRADLTQREDMLRSGEGVTDFDRSRKQADRVLDDLLIARTDLGQRTAFISREEWRTAQDSSKALSRRVSAMALPPSEPMKLMADRMKADAEAGFSEATKLRKRADRSEDILQRDSLYRRAYARELAALRDMDRAITVQNHVLGTDFQRGQLLAYEEVEALMFGVPEPAVALARKDGGTGTDEAKADAPDLDTGRDDGSVAATQEAGAAERGSGTASAPEDAASSARRLLDEAQALDLRATELLSKAEGSERAAASARPRERAELMEQAANDRRLADELAVEAGLKRAEAAGLLKEDLDVAEADALRDRLHRYYYLSESEERMVIDDTDMSRYFSARARALELEDKADEMERDAGVNDGLSTMLKEQAGVIAAEGIQGAESAAQLRERAAKLDLRTDSLRAEAAKARAAAEMNNAQAAGMLQGMRPADADGLMALEMRTRRTEPMLSAAAASQSRDAATGITPGTDERALADNNEAGRTNADQPPAPGRTGSGVSPQDDGRSGERGAGEGATARQGEPGEGSGMADAAPVSGGEPDAPKAAAPAPGEAMHSSTDPVRDAVDAGASEVARDLPASANGTDARVPSGVPSDGSTAPVAFRPVATAAPAASGFALPLLPEELVRDEFVLLPMQAKRSTPIVMNAPIPKGVVYKVQVGAFRNEVPADVFEDLAPLAGEELPNGLKRYTAGMFTGFEGADAAREQVRARGYTDAFVTAYVDGRRVSITEAREEAVRRGQGTATAPVARHVEQDAAAPLPVVIAPVVPAAAVPVAAAEETDRLLEAYPPTAEAILSAFTPAPDAASYYDATPGAAPAKQVETVKGLFFTVQVGVYSKPVALDKLFNITPLNSERIDGGKIRYTTGRYGDMDRVRQRKDEAVRLGVTDAFITAYINGKRIPVREATALLERFGVSILADPQQ